ncbi:hypothetical protein Smar_0512 [Staphylothermus marinus F1]|uniref:Uncharacterized protein n=1 Tax=Staphylothermus marinus (strain ATCC 43588 / DSM 3639 / JCM 9404 / F1) TaxID=399550 RepID=A3DLW0_STAMF|nr:hypothetical protein [Staphylothermus marinus]ABN69620.1 hypothetical protein Smar_0512 [Staphylothermus marinus F1]
MKLRIKWGNGSLYTELHEDTLIIYSSNFSLELRPRTIIIDNYRGYRIGEDNKRKYIYVYLKEKINPYATPPQITPAKKPVLIGDYQIVYTTTKYDIYYTIITPGYTLYEYVIITSDEVGIALSRKRETYFEETDNKLIVYLV